MTLIIEMEKLKTLKDFEQYCLKDFMSNEPPRAGNYDAIVNFYKIKQEAIKWVKSRNTGGFSFVIDFDGKVSKWNKEKEKLNSIDYANLGAMIELINFFNITKEDLI